MPGYAVPHRSAAGALFLPRPAQALDYLPGRGTGGSTCLRRPAACLAMEKGSQLKYRQAIQLQALALGQQSHQRTSQHVPAAALGQRR